MVGIPGRDGGGPGGSASRFGNDPDCHASDGGRFGVRHFLTGGIGLPASKEVWHLQASALIFVYF